MSRYLLFREHEKVSHFQPFSQYFPDFKPECWWEQKRIYLLGEEEISYSFSYRWCDFSKQRSANPLPTVTGTGFFFLTTLWEPKVFEDTKTGALCLVLLSDCDFFPSIGKSKDQVSSFAPIYTNFQALHPLDAIFFNYSLPSIRHHTHCEGFCWA